MAESSDTPNDTVNESAATETPATETEQSSEPAATGAEETPPVEPDADPDAPFGRRADGTPAKKRGRKPKAESEAAQAQQTRERLTSVTRPPPKPQAPAPIPTAQPIVADYRTIGRSYAALWFTVGTIALGADWQPQPPRKEGEPGEADVVAGAFERWARAKQLTGLDPTTELAATLLGYAVLRLERPTVKERITGAWLWAKTRISKMMPKR